MQNNQNEIAKQESFIKKAKRKRILRNPVRVAFCRNDVAGHVVYVNCKTNRKVVDFLHSTF